jgi:hypothetical protein
LSLEFLFVHPAEIRVSPSVTGDLMTRGVHPLSVSQHEFKNLVGAGAYLDDSRITS